MNRCIVTFKGINFDKKKYDISLVLTNRAEEDNEFNTEEIDRDYQRTENSLWKIYKMIQEYEKEQKKN